MSFTNAEIKKLRQRLGWSMAEMARRLGCEVELLGAWESGTSKPDNETLNQLRSLGQQAEAYSDMIAQDPLIEKNLEERRAGQLTHRDSIKDS